MFSFGIGRAPEGVLFGIVVAVSLLRLPGTWRFLCSSFLDSSAILWCALLLIFIGISWLWSPQGAQADPYPPRHLLYPFLLLPLAARWRWLAWSYVAGIGFQAAWMILEYLCLEPGIYVYGYPLGSSRNVHFWGAPTATATFLALALAMESTASVASRVLASLLAGLCCSASLLIASRSTAVSLAAGVLVLVVLAVRQRRISARGLAIGSMALVSLLALSGTLLWSRIARTPAYMAEGSMAQRMDRLLSARWTMWTTSLPAWTEHPVVGWGRDGWTVAYAKGLEGLADNALPATRTELSRLNTAHSTYVQILIDQGLLGAVMLACSIVALARLALTTAGPSALMLGSLLAAWCVSGLTLSELNTSHGLVPFGLMMWLAGISAIDRLEEYPPCR
jgi:O-antigen ligase